MNRIEWYYQNIGKRDLLYKLNFINVHQLPKIKNISINVNTKTTLIDKKKVLPLISGLEIIAGQKMKKTYAKKSIAAFKLRKGQILGGAATLRNEKLYNFLEKLFFIVLPKNRDFSKINSQSSITTVDVLNNSFLVSMKTNPESTHWNQVPGQSKLPEYNFIHLFRYWKVKNQTTILNLTGQPFLFYPELENHYELFESIKGFDVSIQIQCPTISIPLLSGFPSIEKEFHHASLETINFKRQSYSISTEKSFLSLFMPC